MHITLPIIANLRLNTPPLTYKRHVLKQQKKQKNGIHLLQVKNNKHSYDKCDFLEGYGGFLNPGSSTLKKNALSYNYVLVKKDLIYHHIFIWAS